jgi:hypothetical protein
MAYEPYPLFSRGGNVAKEIELATSFFMNFQFHNKLKLQGSKPIQDTASKCLAQPF